MQIISPNPMQQAKEHDKILRRLLAQRAREWQCQNGIRRLATRIKIEVWAWLETNREQRRNHKKNSPYKF